VPSSSTEFYQRFPAYLANWVGKRTRDAPPGQRRKTGRRNGSFR
jgi:hypothetical protein